MTRPRLALAGLSVVLLTGCGTDRSTYPSLLPRPIEKRSEAEPIVVVPIARPDPALDAEIAKARDARIAQARRFDELAATAERLTTAAHGAAVGDERWIAAQSALAEVEAERAQALGKVSDLEQAATDRGVAGQPAYPALDQEIAAGRAELAREDQRTAVIAARLPSPK